MIVFVAKSTSINLRITPEFREDLEQLATYRGLTLSGVAHSLLVRAVRIEKEKEPDAFITTGSKVRNFTDSNSMKDGIEFKPQSESPMTAKPIGRILPKKKQERKLG